MRESYMRRVVMKALRGLHPTPVENSVMPGTPDINFAGGWVELKQIPIFPREDAIVRVPHFSPQQRIWLRKRWNTGKESWLLLHVGSPKTWILLEGDVAADHLGKITRRELFNSAIAVWQPNMDSAMLRQILKHGRP